MRYFTFELCTLLRCVLLAGFLLRGESAVAQTISDDNHHSQRISLSGGMGVNYHNAQDIVERINGSGIVAQRVDYFKSGVEFFGAISVPLNRDWAAKLEYVYLFAGYTLPSSVAGNAEFSYVLHMPTLIGQYVLFGASTYNLKAGIGIGYHIASYDERFFHSSFSAKGLGSLLELEGNTALGEDIYAHLGAQLRWEFVGELRDGAGRGPLPNASTSLNFFSIGARLGMSFCF